MTMNSFDKIIAEKLEAANQYAPDQSMWARIEQDLAASPSASSAHSGKAGFIGGIAASILMGVLITQLPSLGPIQHNALQTSFELENVSIISNASTELTAPAFEAQQRHEISLMDGPDANTVKEPVITKKQTVNKANDGSVSEEVEAIDKAAELANGTAPDHSPSQQHAKKVQPELNFSATGIQCAGEEVVFEVKGSFDKVEWLFDGIDFATQQVAHHAFDEAGTHQVMLIAYENDERYTTTKEIEVYPSPEPRIMSEVTNSEDCFKATAIWTADPGTNAYKWTIDGNQIDGNRASFLLENGRYNASLEAINEHGCVSEHVRSIEVTKARDLFIPTAFSPDNDGTNDEWFPEGLEEVERFDVKVYELTSKRLVYRTVEARPWNGRVNGTAEQAKRGDKFIYEVIATDHCGNRIKRDGVITAF